MTREEKYMMLAIEEGRIAALEGEVPVGAIVVYQDKVIAKAHNTREKDKCATSHAEIKAIEEACRIRGGWRLFDCELYVTLEPCAMCSGAAINARIDRIIYGASDIRYGAVGSLINLMDYGFNHKCEIESGVLGDQCSTLLSEFFSERRKINARQ